VVGSRGAAVVVVDADVGAGCVGDVGCATPGVRRGGSGWGSRVAEATTAARSAVVSPKTNSSSLQGRRGVARCRGGGVGMVRRPGLTCASVCRVSVEAARLPGTKNLAAHSGSNGPFLPGGRRCRQAGGRPASCLAWRTACWTRSVPAPANLPACSPRSGQPSDGPWPRWRCCPAGSVPHLMLAPEGVDQVVPFVGDLLEGLVGLLFHDL
jgi:hypothetical protein